ncbi:MAG: T9SS type A sorting domain-containing protein [Emticicia sp.]
MRFFLIILFLAFQKLSFAQNLAIHWQKSLGGKNNEYAYATTPTADGGYVIVGSTNNNKDGDVPASKAYSGVGGSDIWVVKLNNWGEIEWSKTFGGTQADIATDVLETKDKGILLVATTSSTDGEATGNGSRGGLILLKLKTDGSIEWRKVIASGYSIGEISFARADANSKPSIKPTADGGYILGATINPVNTTDFWLSKLNATGDIQWTRTYGSVSNDSMNEVIACADGGFLMVGGTEASNLEISGAGKGFIDFCIMKTDATGRLLWQRALGGTNLDIAYSAIETTDNAYIIVGETNSTNGDMTPNLGQKDGVLAKYSAVEGRLLWKVLTGGDDIDGLYTIKKASTGKLFAMGMSSSVIGKVKPSGPVGDIWVVNIENSGVISSHAMFGGADTDIARGAFPIADGGFVIAGNSDSVDGDVTENKGGTDFWALKIGNQLPVDIRTYTITITPEQFVKVAWETSTEVQSKNFIVERSIDGSKFTILGQVLAAANSTTKKSYSYIDQRPFLGKNYYRLKFYDASGKEFIYKTLTVTVSILGEEVNLSEQKIRISPNPVVNESFFVETLDKSVSNIRLLNLLGLPIPIESVVLNNQKTLISLPKNTHSGLYFLVFEIGETQFTEKIIIQ